MSVGLPAIHGVFGVVADPEIRFFDSGNCVVNLRLVAKKRVRDSNGQWSDGPVPLFIDCSVFGKQAEHLTDSVAKGDTITVEGYLEQQEWTDKDSGEKRTKVNIVAEEVGVSVKWGPAKTGRVLEGQFGGQSAPKSEEPPF